MTATQIAWRDDVTGATGEAKASGKPLLIHFYSETCLGCAELAKVTYPEASITRR